MSGHYGAVRLIRLTEPAQWRAYAHLDQGTAHMDASKVFDSYDDAWAWAKEVFDLFEGVA